MLLYLGGPFTYLTNNLTYIKEFILYTNVYFFLKITKLCMQFRFKEINKEFEKKINHIYLTNYFHENEKSN